MTGTPGWYPDPTGRFEYRYHNGQTWTADVALEGERYVDPLVRVAPTVPPPVPGAPAPRNGLALAGMVCGIVGLCIAWVPFLAYVGLIASVVGIVLSVVGLRRSRRTRAGRSFAVTGVATGAGGIAASVLGIWLTAVVVDRIDDYTSPEPSEVTITSCTRSSGQVVVEGEIANLGDEHQRYSVAVEVEVGGSTDVERVAVEAVEPGRRRSFRTAVRVPAGDGPPACRVVAVDGPLPFGLDPDARD